MREIEIPLHQLEQKVQQLESHVSNYSVDELSCAVIAKINKDLKGALPGVWTELNRIKY